MARFVEELLARFRWVDGHADLLAPLGDAGFLRRAVEALAEPFRDEPVTKVAAIEARGFVLGTGVALLLGAGVVLVRKDGSVFPGAKATRVTEPDWRGRTPELQVQRHGIGSDDRVLLVDDWAETGSQALAARWLIEECGGTWVGLSLLVDQLEEGIRSRLAPVHAVVRYDDLPGSE